jgi:hypothetical protein
MRPTQFRHCATAGPFFTSPKCKVAISVREALLRYAIQQAILDSLVRAIRYRKGLELQCPKVSLTGVVLDRVDGNFLLKVCETRPKRSEKDLARLTYALGRYGLRLLERDALDVKREPLFSNARTVWSQSRFNVSVSDRLTIGAALHADGPQSIRQLNAHARPSCDILAAVCALACENLVKLDIADTRLGSSTMVCLGDRSTATATKTAA